MPFPDDDDLAWDISEILKLRMNVAGSEELFERLLNLDGELSEAELLRAMDVARTKVEVALRELWDPATRSTIAALRQLPSSVVSWHNGNIRNVSQSVVDLANTPVDPTHLGPDNQTTRRRVRNRVYRHIISSRSGVGGGHPGAMHSSLSLFVAQPEETAPHRPFYFLKFRVLSHLSHVGKSRTVNMLYDTFERYGVSPGAIRNALNAIASREGYDSGFVRFESRTGHMDLLTGEEEGEVQVEILPAGSYAANALVLTCEYLYWAAIELNELREDVSRIAGKKPEALYNELPTDRVKVMVATAMLRNYLLPRFEREHPYMRPGSTFDDRDCRRLRLFQEDFGYQRQNWFIKRIRDSIEAHAEGLASVPRTTQDDWEYVRERERRLDHVLDYALRQGF